MVRTGYESVIAHRTSSLFAYTAKKPGIVKNITPKSILIEYDDKEITGYELGRIFGNAAGLTIPHNITTTLKVDDRVDIGDAICFNDGFFEPDIFNPKRVIYKCSTTLKTVLWESSLTLEDSSVISSRASNKLMTNVTKVKVIVLTFDQSVSRLVKVGEQIDSESILCIIEDAITSDNKLFDEQSIDTLKAIGAQTPRAHVKGIVEKVEVFYNGDKEDMSESLQKLVADNDRLLKKQADNLNRRIYTGSVDGGFRVDGNPLVLDSMAIRIYITVPVPMSIGD